jgi:hypothetical protein
MIDFANWSNHTQAHVVIHKPIFQVLHMLGVTTGRKLASTFLPVTKIVWVDLQCVGWICHRTVARLWVGFAFASLVTHPAKHWPAD